MTEQENKTVTIKRDFEVPEGDRCFQYNNEHDAVIFECDSFIGDLSGCAIWPNGHLEPAEDESYVIKCDPCKAECEKAKGVCTHEKWTVYGTAENQPHGKKCDKCGKWEDICETCDGDEEIDIIDGGYTGKTQPCPDCQPKGVEDESN